MIAAWVSVCMLVLYLSLSLDNCINLDFKKKIVTFFQDFQSMRFSEVIERSNIIFISLFDIVYIDKTSKSFRYSFWTLIIISLFFAYSIVPISQLQKMYIPSLENILVISLFVAGIFWSGWIIHHHFGKLKLISIIFAIIIVYVFNKLSLISSAPFALLLSILLLGYLNIFYYVEKKITQTIDLSIFQISPFRVMLSSLFAIFIISLVKQDVLKIFVSDFNQAGVILFSFFLLNVFADSISLWETRIILNLANTGSIFRLFTVLLLDVFFSIVIFLSIPISTGNLDVFLNAIFFEGNLPWLGILFWSTFFTSIVFWFYLLAIILLKILQKPAQLFIKLDVVLPINDNPVFCLGLLFMVPVTLSFMLMALF